MKQTILFILISLYSIGISAQVEDANVMIKVAGGYNEFNTTNGAYYTGSYSTENTNGNIGLSIGKMIGNRWELGIGIDYQKQNMETYSLIYIPEHFINQEKTTTNAHLLMGKVYTAYYWRLFHRLYFHPHIGLVYGKATGKQTSLAAYSPRIIEDLSQLQYNFPISLAYGREQDFSYSYQAVNFVPGFSFFLSKHFAIHLETGNFQCRFTDWKWANRQWAASLKPADWDLGIILAF